MNCDHVNDSLIPWRWTTPWDRQGRDARFPANQSVEEAYDVRQICFWNIITISVEVNVAIIKCNEIIRCVKIFPSDSIKKLPNTGIDQLIQAK